MADKEELKQVEELFTPWAIQQATEAVADAMDTLPDDDAERVALAALNAAVGASHE
jgi:hypothetical protein